MRLVLLKHRAAAQGEVRRWADGKARKKVGQKWIVVEEETRPVEQVRDKALQRAEDYFDYSLTSNLGGELETALNELDIYGFQGLSDRIKGQRPDEASKIYRHVVDHIRGVNAAPGDKQAVLDLFGRGLIQLKDYFAEGPKTKATIKKTGKGGGVYYDQKDRNPVETELPLLKPSAIADAKKKVGGWSVTGPLRTTHVEKMLKTGTAELVSGKINAKKKWELPQKAKDMEIKYKGDGLWITAKQTKPSKTGKSRLTTASVRIKIPYAYAKAYLKAQIESTRTANNLIFRMERSAGYRDFLEREGSHGGQKPTDV